MHFFKYKQAIAILVIIFNLFCVPRANILAYAFSEKEQNYSEYVIVIDAGHGGHDVGAIGVNTKVLESELNLIFAKKLEKAFKNMGFNVVLTRKDNKIDDSIKKFNKREDMERRREFIQKSNPDIVLSLHMNEYTPQPHQAGAQVFYHPSSPSSKLLANYIQKHFNENQTKERIILAEEFFLLDNSSVPSVIVECGFLSNPEEEVLLQKEHHQDKIVHLILLGTLEYLYTQN